MSRKTHPKHRIIAEVIEKVLPKQYTLIKDEACGGKQRIPLFKATKKSRKEEFCNADLLVLKDNKIKIIIEIEESNVKPTQVCGKFLTSALANYFIHNSMGKEPIEMDKSVMFVQIVDSSKLVKGKTSKYAQWRTLEESIKVIIPLENSRIDSYRLIAFDDVEKLASDIRDIFNSPF